MSNILINNKIKMNQKTGIFKTNKNRKKHTKLPYLDIFIN